MTKNNNFKFSSLSQKINLFCIPFAGGSYYAYKNFENHVADFINVVPIDIPGRGRRWGKPLLTSMHDMAEDVYQQIKEKLDEPFAVYGHSMGSTVGYLLAEKLIREKKTAIPLHLFASGRQGPPVPTKEKDIYLLPEKEFIEKILAYGGTPREIAESKEMMELFVPIMRADFQAVSTYEYEKTEPLDIPISVLIGDNEKFTYEEAHTWQAVTKRNIFLKQFPGDHFFIFDHLPEIGSIISRTLEKRRSVPSFKGKF